MQKKNSQLHTATSTDVALPPVQIDVVARELCIGCGTCAGVCPSNCLEMAFNDYGEYNPSGGEGCTECGLCASVCPFMPGNPDEDALSAALFSRVTGIGRRTECGYYLSSFVGYSTIESQRENAASGGLATWTLQELLKTGSVDKVICASPNPDPDKLFRFAITDTPGQVQACAKSCYYPLEVSEVVRYVLANEGRYAVIGLPCYLKALRLAEMRNNRLRKRMVVHAGLVCGRLASKALSEYGIRLAGGDPHNVDRISFREKAGAANAYDISFAYHHRAGSEPTTGSIRWTEGFGQAWNSGCFKPNACNYCDDIFAEVADCVFMDAWLQPYSNDPKGTSIVVARTRQIDQLLREGISRGELDACETAIERAIASQAAVVHSKRRNLMVRLEIDRLDGRRSPEKRVCAAEDSSASELQAQRNAITTAHASRVAWSESRTKPMRQFQRRVPALQALLRKRQRDLLVSRIRKTAKRIVLGHKAI